MVVNSSPRIAAVIALAGALLVGSALGCTGRVDVVGACEPGAQELCYSGPEGTAGVGHCRSGVRTCSEDGAGFGACEGEILPAPEDCAAPGDEDCDGHPGVCTGTPEWARRFSGTGNQSLDSLAVTPAGEVAFGDWFSGDLDVGIPVGTLSPAAGGGAVVKLDSSGAPLFGALIDGYVSWVLAGADASGGVAGAFSFGEAVDFGGQTFTSESMGDALVYNLSPDGESSASVQIKGTGFVDVDALDVSPAGDLVLGGMAQGPLDAGGGTLSGGEWPTFLARYDPFGAHVWSKVISPLNVIDVRFGPQGDIFLGGWSVGPENSLSVTVLDSGGGSLWSRTIGAVSSEGSGSMHIAPTPDGGVYLAGTFSATWDLGAGPVTAKGKDEAFLVKLAKGGDYQWGKTFGDGDPQYTLAVACDAAGNAVMVNGFRGTIDLGAGALHSSSALTDDTAVTKFAPDGTPKWSRRFGEASNLYISEVATDAAGAIYLGGDVLGDIDFGSGPLPGTGHADIVIVKLAP